MGIKTAVTALSLCLMSFEATAYFDTGNDFLALCRKNDGFAQGICMGKAGATLDAMQAAGYRCSVQGVTQGQAMEVVVQHMTKNPQDRHYGATLLMFEAFINAFGCKTK